MIFNLTFLSPLSWENMKEVEAIYELVFWIV